MHVVEVLSTLVEVKSIKTTAAEVATAAIIVRSDAPVLCSLSLFIHSRVCSCTGLLLA